MIVVIHTVIKKTISVIMLFAIIISFGWFQFAGAISLNGDGSHVIQRGDTIILDNGWKINIEDILNAHAGGQIQFNIVAPKNSGIYITENNHTLQKIEGSQKFGSEEVLYMKVELMGVSGEVTPTASPLVSRHSEATINVFSINEQLPGFVGNNDFDPTVTEINEELLYSSAYEVELLLNESTTLGNGNVLVFKGLSRFDSASFSLSDDEGIMIEDNIMRGVGTTMSIGSLVKISHISSNSVGLKIINGSKLSFGTGWNFFSISLEDGDGYGTIKESTCNDAYIWSWNTALGDYVQESILLEGEKIPAYKGLWVKVQTNPNTASDVDCEVIVSGVQPVSTHGRQLRAGWNAIPAPMSALGRRELNQEGSSFHWLTFNDIKGTCTINRGPLQFLGTPWSHEFISSEISQSRVFSHPFEDRILLHRGYFIHVASDCLLSDI